ncbi:MAG: 4a-hydroxytetrahydrobiopterin dehydratase [Tepidisphaeraceae bacterium]
MGSTTKLSPDEIQHRLSALPGWGIEFGMLCRTFQFADFPRAFGFMAAAATVAQAMNHHPDWSNVYRTVQVRLTTHDVGGLTELDFQLAERMNELAGS